VPQLDWRLAVNNLVPRLRVEYDATVVGPRRNYQVYEELDFLLAYSVYKGSLFIFYIKLLALNIPQPFIYYTRDTCHSLSVTTHVTVFQLLHMTAFQLLPM